jgi:rubrerythrin
MYDDINTVLNGIDPGLAGHLSRRGAIRSALKKLGVAATAPTIFAAAAGEAFGKGGALPREVRDVLNFALTLEYLEDEFYRTALDKDGLIPSDNHAMFETIGKHEMEHVAVLKSALGEEAVKKPEFDFTAKGAFGDVFTNFKTFLDLAQAFEDTGVRAYKGQAGNLLGHDEVLTTALRIHSVEARHAAHVRRLRGQPEWIVSNSRGDLPEAVQPVYNGEAEYTQGGVDLRSLAKSAQGDLSLDVLSGAFDEPLSKEKVLEIAKPFIKA